ncbi:hypothetical protein B5807_09151 [Epicoccum nigrum]|uniref:MYND-type domain-containing protein n=1 Tax=Epicoccum nigrum TaxID=105696 RepID=A0A1Y2LN15_EPING|nr:hypothetical protein B5807_09151 [Epicoccum nigrum]
MAAAIEPLDLVDIAVLLNYERATTTEAFRNTKVREIAYPGDALHTLRYGSEPPADWNRNDRTVIVLDKVSPQGDRQLPATMKSPVNFVSSNLTEQQLETIFYRIRAHEGSVLVTLLLEAFFSMFPPDTKLCIRHAPKDKQPNTFYITSICNRSIVQDVLVKPKFSTVLVVPQERRMKHSGTGPEMAHWYTGFSAPNSEEITSVLDLTSMQFGEVGRGPGREGRMLFALDTKTDYEERLNRIANGVDLARRQVNTSMVMAGGAPLEKVVCKVKERWEKRDTEKWCGHCGAPEPEFRCAGCRNVWFCNKEHQKMMWSFHKGYCNKG